MDNKNIFQIFLGLENVSLFTTTSVNLENTTALKEARHKRPHSEWFHFQNRQIQRDRKEIRDCLEWRRQWHPTPELLPGKSHGWKSLVGCSPWGPEESDTTERLHFHFSLSCIGEGNGNPLQCSCLENPRDRGAWWAAVYGVAQSWTRLKWLSRVEKGV